MSSQKCLLPDSLSLWGAQLLPASLGGSLRSASGSDQAPLRLLPLCWEAKLVRFWACPLRAESLFSLALWFSQTQDFLVFKAKCSEGLSSWWRTPRLGSLVWGSDRLVLGEELLRFWYYFHLWFDNLRKWILTIWHLSLSYSSPCFPFFMCLVVEDSSC